MSARSESPKHRGPPGFGGKARTRSRPIPARVGVADRGDVRHRASGDTPGSGDILATTLAICEKSTLRSVAANPGIELEEAKVQVDIDSDFRATMATDRDVPVGATGIRMRTRAKLKEGPLSITKESDRG